MKLLAIAVCVALSVGVASAQGPYGYVVLGSPGYGSQGYSQPAYGSQGYSGGYGSQGYGSQGYSGGYGYGGYYRAYRPPVYAPPVTAVPRVYGTAGRVCVGGVCY